MFHKNKHLVNIVHSRIYINTQADIRGGKTDKKIAQPLLLGKANFRKQHTHINISHMKDGINEHFLLPSSFLTLLDRLSNLVPSKTNLLLFLCLDELTVVLCVFVCVSIKPIGGLCVGLQNMR